MANTVLAPVAEVAALMSTFPASWALCGGWAVDAWLGRQSREHGDVDIAVFHDDQLLLFRHLTAWQLIAHDPNVPDNTADPWTGRWLDLPAHVHARPQGTGPQISGALNSANAAGFGLDIQLGEREGDDWLISREPRIGIPAAECIAESAWGLPAVVPEVLLAFKALERRPQDELDFLALRPSLTRSQRLRLRRAVASLDGQQAWLAALADD